MGCSPPGPSVKGVFRQEHGNGLPFPTPEDLPEPGIEPMSPESPALTGVFFTTSTTWETLITMGLYKYFPYATQMSSGGFSDLLKIW